MNNRVALYESLVRLSLVLVFLFALTVGIYGLGSIYQIIMHSEVPQPEFVTRDLS